MTLNSNPGKAITSLYSISGVGVKVNARKG